MSRIACALVLLAVLVCGLGDVAWADEPAPEAAAPARDRLPSPLDEIARAFMVVFVGVALGAIVLLVRTILPGMARVTDASLGRLTTLRLMLFGLLPILGAGFLHRGLELLGNKVLLQIYGLGLMVPMALLGMAGLSAAVPHLGRSILRKEPEPSPLAAGLWGGLVIGLAAVSAALPALGALVGLLVASWCLGIGLGTLIRPRRPSAATD